MAERYINPAAVRWLACLSGILSVGLLVLELAWRGRAGWLSIPAGVAAGLLFCAAYYLERRLCAKLRQG